MIEFALATAVTTITAHSQPNIEKVNQFCSYLVGIPYASDNFTDAEYQRFLVCKEVFE
jgi:hypothetical protein